MFFKFHSFKIGLNFEVNHAVYRQRPRNPSNFNLFFWKQLLLHSDQVYVACFCISFKILQCRSSKACYINVIIWKYFRMTQYFWEWLFVLPFTEVRKSKDRNEIDSNMTSFISHHDYVLSFIRHFLWSWLTICRRSCKGKVPHRRNRT